MKTYRIEQFGIEIIDPVIIKITSSFSIGSEFVDVHAVLKVSGMNGISVYLGQMENTDTWDDEDVINFATLALENFLVE